MAKVTLDDFVILDQKEQSKALSIFQNSAAEYYLNFVKANPALKKGERLTPAQAEDVANNILKQAAADYMKEYQGIADPKISDFESFALSVLGMHPTQLKEQLQNQPITLDTFAQLGRRLGQRVLQVKQQSLSTKLNDTLLDSDDFRKQFGEFVKSKGYELDSGRLTRMSSELFMETYGALTKSNDELQALHGSYLKPYKAPEKKA